MMSANFVKTLACVIAITSVFSRAKAVSFVDSKALYDKVFATKGTSLEPAKVRGHLEDLKASYFGLNDEGSRSLGKTLSSLIDVCDTSNSAKCYHGPFLKFDSLIKANSQFSVNIVPYLQHCRSKMFHRCKQVFDGELQKSVKHLDNYSKEEIKTLVEEIVEKSTEKITAFSHKIPLEALKKGVKSFLEKHNYLAANFAQVNVSKENKCKRGLNTVCDTIVEDIGTSTQHYEQQFMANQDLAAKLEPFELDWVLKVKVCRFIQQNLNVIC